MSTGMGAVPTATGWDTLRNFTAVNKEEEIIGFSRRLFSCWPLYPQPLVLFHALVFIFPRWWLRLVQGGYFRRPGTCSAALVRGLSLPRACLAFCVGLKLVHINGE